MPNTCIVCGSVAGRDPSVSFHCFPSDVNRRRVWLGVYDLTEEQWKPYWKICSRHFPGGDVRLVPEIQKGKRTASRPGKPAKRAQAQLTRNARHSHRQRRGYDVIQPAQAPPPLITTVVEPREKTQCPEQEPPLHEPTPMDDKGEATAASREIPSSPSSRNFEVMVHTALLDQVKALDRENQLLKQQVAPLPSITVRVVDISSGGPALGVPVALSQWQADTSSWSSLGSGVTSSDGTCTNLLAAPELSPGLYSLNFDTQTYFTAHSNLQHYYPHVEVTFCLEQSSKHHNVSLMLSPFSYTTCTDCVTLSEM